MIYLVPSGEVPNRDSGDGARNAKHTEGNARAQVDSARNFMTASVYRETTAARLERPGSRVRRDSQSASTHPPGTLILQKWNIPLAPSRIARTLWFRWLSISVANPSRLWTPLRSHG